MNNTPNQINSSHRQCQQLIIPCKLKGNSHIGTVSVSICLAIIHGIAKFIVGVEILIYTRVFEIKRKSRYVILVRLLAI